LQVWAPVVVATVNSSASLISSATTKILAPMLFWVLAASLLNLNDSVIMWIFYVFDDSVVVRRLKVATVWPWEHVFIPGFGSLTTTLPNTALVWVGSWITFDVVNVNMWVLLFVHPHLVFEVNIIWIR